MPVYLQKQFGEDTFLAIWAITEHKDELLQFIGEDVHDEQARKDNMHWLASRALIRHLFPDHIVKVLKDEFNKPSLTVDGIHYPVSITHSYAFAAVIVSRTQAVSIDMEKLDERIGKVKHKFTREDEFTFLDPDYDMEMLTILWSAKETLYKFYGKKELDFKLNLEIVPFRYPLQGPLTGKITKNGFHAALEIEVAIMNGYVLTYIVNGHLPEDQSITGLV